MSCGRSCVLIFHFNKSLGITGEDYGTQSIKKVCATSLLVAVSRGPMKVAFLSCDVTRTFLVTKAEILEMMVDPVELGCYI